MTSPRTVRDHLRDYLTLAGGSVGRLVIALAYFLIAANVLSLADFGLFATASGAGILLSRVAAFGFISPLFRAATVRPRLTGTYLAGYLFLFVPSVPLLVVLATGLRFSVFGDMPLAALVLILCAEVLGWRMLEVVAIINNGLRAFGKATMLILAGSAIRTLAALGFWWFGFSSLTEWAWTYLAANLVAAALAFSVFLPPLRLRLRPALYGRQMRDALPAATADIIFYLQAELDKAVVLVMAGPRVAGLYAIAMRIVDLTAMPVRSFNQLIMQQIMTDRQVRTKTPMLLLVELAIAAVSIGGLLAAMALLWWNPLVLGRNIGAASALFPLLLAVPALRNLIEYHSELLYGLERTGLRAALLATIAVLKAGLLALVISLSTSELGWAPWLNAIFVALYTVSAATIWQVIRKPAGNRP
ncbi:MAG: lipopolysaccharide biosynthesis protein [Bosea sp. (in: a-proteobacteria)]|jgi:O-antigen/teichoic acid export membrane protein